MKKTIIGILVAILFISTFSFCSYYEHHYSRLGVVTGLTDNGMFEFLDTTGNIWEFEVNGQTVKVGDNVKIIMNDAYTTSIYDDYAESYTLE